MPEPSAGESWRCCGHFGQRGNPGNQTRQRGRRGHVEHLVEMIRIVNFLLTLPAVAATLNFDGQSSSILFGNSARLTATCENNAVDCCAMATGSAAVTRMAPKSFYGIPSNGAVRLRLSGVPLSCANVAENAPCALAYDELDLPAFYCAWANSAANEVVGPVAATVSFHASVNSSQRTTMLARLHGAHMSPCATGCERSPAFMTAVLACPLPVAISDFVSGSGGAGTLTLSVSYNAAPSSAGAVPLPFVNASNLLTIQLTPPSPPQMPPPPSLPPPSAPAPELMPWYKYTDGGTSSSPGSDSSIRLVPVYIPGGVSTYSMSNYIASCRSKDVRTFQDDGSSNGCSTNSDKICSGYGTTHSGCNRGGHSFMNNLISMMSNSAETAHCGFPLATAAQMAADLHSLNVPTGTHTFAIKHGHAENALAAYISATLNTGNSFSSISGYTTGNPSYDIAM